MMNKKRGGRVCVEFLKVVFFLCVTEQCRKIKHINNRNYYIKILTSGVTGVFFMTNACVA